MSRGPSRIYLVFAVSPQGTVGSVILAPTAFAGSVVALTPEEADKAAAKLVGSKVMVRAYPVADEDFDAFHTILERTATRAIDAMKAAK